MLLRLVELLALLALVALTQTLHVNSAEGPDIHMPSIFGGLQRGEAMTSFGMTLNNANVPVAEQKPEFWRDLAYSGLRERLNRPSYLGQAKNVIMFLGDGMSLSALTAARILKGQRQGKPGEEEALSFEKFPYTGLSRTYCTNSQVPDSACTATAYLCGVKSNILTLGVSANVNFNNCTASMDPANHVSSIAAWAQAAGKSTGFVTTTSLTHASPSGSYAHSANRFWESDTDIRTYAYPGTDPSQCMDIAQQLVTQAPGRNFDLMMGGGMGKFLPNTLHDLHGHLGERGDGRNLLSRWQGLHPKGLIVKNREQLMRLNLTRVSHIMGLFNSKLMNFHQKADPYVEPTLAEMTQVALKFLNIKSRGKGYFVFIEGGLIDYGNHQNQAGIALDETLEFEKAVQLARDLTDPKDTLIVVTADHSHPLSVSGYPERGNSILNLNENGRDSRSVPYSTLNYAVGPKQYLDDKGNRLDLTGQMGGTDFIFPSQINSKVGVHGGDDVGVFASGPHEHLFRGVMEQSLLPHLMAYAACWGDGPTMCDAKN